MPGPRSKRRILLWSAAALVGLVGLSFAFFLDGYRTPSGSMLPTMEVGEHFIAQDLSYQFGNPEVNDIVVFHPPQGADSSSRCGVSMARGQACDTPVGEPPEDVVFIKRIVATPGDTLAIEDGRTILNGEQVPEDFIKPCGAVVRGCNLPEEITIPEDHYFVMGDNRGASEDSRLWGPVPRDWIEGKALLTYWPDQLGFF